MDVFGLSCIETNQLPSGSLRLKQRFSVPLQEAWLASLPFVAVSALGWQDACSKPFTALKDSHAAGIEALQELTEKTALELMMLCQAAPKSKVNKAAQLNGLKPEQLIISLDRKQLFQARWLAVLSHLLQADDQPRRNLSRLKNIGELFHTRLWLAMQTRQIGPELFMRSSEPQPLDLISPDFQLRVKISASQQLALWINQPLETRPTVQLKRYESRGQILKEVARKLDRRPEMNKDMLWMSELRDQWQGQPLSFSCVRPWDRAGLRLTTSDIFKVDNQASAGYLRSSLKQQAEKETIEALAQKLTPSGLVNQACQAVTSRTAPSGNFSFLQPLGSYAAN